MTLPPRNHSIPLSEAAELTRRYRSAEGPKAIKAGAFHADQVRALLDQEGCVAFRIYFGRNIDGTDTLVLVGVDKDDKDMTDGRLAEFIFPCPPFCTDGSALNG